MKDLYVHPPQTLKIPSFVLGGVLVRNICSQMLFQSKSKKNMHSELRYAIKALYTIRVTHIIIVLLSPFKPHWNSNESLLRYRYHCVPTLSLTLCAELDTGKRGCRLSQFKNNYISTNTCALGCTKIPSETFWTSAFHENKSQETDEK